MDQSSAMWNTAVPEEGLRISEISQSVMEQGKALEISSAGMNGNREAAVISSALEAKKHQDRMT